MSHIQHSRVIVVLHSHIQQESVTYLSENGGLDLSPDVIAMNTSKSIKGAGGFSITLVPRRNYLNIIFPNDVINIYVDPGDGKSGFVRLMLGYVDRVERTEEVGDNGQVSTQFIVSGTDFVKALDRTEIYFNPYLANRQEFVGVFADRQGGGGSALRTAGIVIHGTPAEFVENFLQLLLGFGQQWVLPPGYPSSSLSDPSKRRSLARFKAHLPQDVKVRLESAFSAHIDSILTGEDVEAKIEAEASVLRGTAGETLAGTSQLTLTNSIPGFNAKQAKLSVAEAAKALRTAYQVMLTESKHLSSHSILDIMSLDFIEKFAIDGYVLNDAIWKSEGSLASIIYGWSNEIVNELCFDLRPVAAGNADQCFGDNTGDQPTVEYSKELDELGININGTDFHKTKVAAIQYEPSVIFREYPYSVVDGIDLSDYYSSLDAIAFGLQEFGPIFAAGVDVGGKRQIHKYRKALTPETCAYDNNSNVALKHIDVVTIDDQDVTHSQLGRSDHDTFNLFALYAASPMGELWEYYLSDFLPIITPATIARYGLRVRKLNTKFANYGRNAVCGKGNTSIQNSVTMRNLLRWTLLLDHWNQHNIEYLSGSLSLRARPDIRVGYRMDWVGRSESYYVEQVSHQWQYPNAFRTSVQVSRGQRNDPFPAYIPPLVPQPSASAISVAAHNQGIFVLSADQRRANDVAVKNAKSQLVSNGGGNRLVDGRLGQFFQIKDTPATYRATDGHPTPLEGASNPRQGNYVDTKEALIKFGRLALVSGELATDSSKTKTEQIDSVVTPPTSTK